MVSGVSTSSTKKKRPKRRKKKSALGLADTDQNSTPPMTPASPRPESSLDFRTRSEIMDSKLEDHSPVRDAGRSAGSAVADSRAITPTIGLDGHHDSVVDSAVSGGESFGQHSSPTGSIAPSEHGT